MEIKVTLNIRTRRPRRGGNPAWETTDVDQYGEAVRLLLQHIKNEIFLDSYDFGERPIATITNIERAE